jgi:autotransporter-associated beta strand protein
MVAQDSASSATADFLTYSTSNGFQKTTNYTTRTGTFTPATYEISNITATATANTGDPYAIRLGAYTLTVASGAALTVGNGTYGGVILNGGTVTGGTLAFNTAAGYVYTSTASTINSPITGTGGLTVFGPGSLRLASSSNTLSGNIVVNGATLNATSDAALGPAANSITLNGGTLAPVNGYTQTQPVTIGSTGGTISISNTLTLTGAITGGGTLTKGGTGSLILSGGSADSLTGNISVNAGILQTANGASLASTTGNITIASGASFDAFGDYDGTIISNPIWVSGTGTSGDGAINGGGNVTLSGAITLNADATISHDFNYFTLSSGITGSNHNLTLASTQLGQPYMAVNDPITLGSGVLTVTGPNGVSLNAVDSYSGGTNVGSGTLQLGNTGALGSGALNVTAGTVDLNGLSVTVNGLAGSASGIIASSSTTSDSTLTVSQTGSSTFAGTLADTLSPGNMRVSLNVSGSGTLTLSGTNTFSGTTRINSGTLILANSLALQNSTLDLDAADAGSISFGSLTTVTLGGLEGSRNLSNGLSLTIGSNGQTTVYSGNLTGAGSVIKTGNGLLEFSGTNNYSGGTTINGGAMQFDSTAAIPTNPTLLTLNTGGAVAATGAYTGVTGWLNSGRISSTTAGALALTSNSGETINLTTAGGGAFSSITLGAVGSVTYTGVYTPLGNTYRFGGGGGTLYYSPAITGSKAVAMANPGTVVLTASNNYSGGTTITAGTLQAGSSSALGSGAISVSGGGSLDLNGYSIGSIPLSIGGAGVNGLGALLNSSATSNASASGTITLTSNATIGVDSSSYAGRMDIGGGTTCINGSTYTLTKAGSGFLRINSGSFTVGAINVSAGALDVLGNSNVLIAGLPVSVSSGATLFLYNVNDAANTTLLAGGTLEDNTGINTVSGTTTLSGSGNTNFDFDNTPGLTLTVSGPITGTGGINMNVGAAGGKLLLTNTGNNYSGGTVINSGTLVLGGNNAFPMSTPLTIANGAAVDIGKYTMAISNSSIGTITREVAAAYNNGLWNGANTSIGVITSSAATADTTHLTAVGVATGLTSFERITVPASDVLVKYTYYGDANLSGTVDGSDYTLIDAGYLQHLTGWQNGDFNYDGMVDGSDYTLIDNSYNMQWVGIAAEIAAPTAQVAQASGSALVPEPGVFSLIAIGATGLLGRRFRVKC